MPKNILVVMREIWDTRNLAGEVLNESGAPRFNTFDTMVEPEDLNALEMALKLRDAHNAPVTVVSLGDSIRVDVLRESLYRGADAAFRLQSAREKTLDALARASLLSGAVERKGPFDLILIGVDVPEGENSQVGSHLASLLGIPQVTYVEDIESAEDNVLVARRAIEGGTQSVRVQMPALLTVGVALTQDDPRTPRSARARLKLQHKKTAIPVLTASELEVSPPDLEPVVELRGHEAVPLHEIHTVHIDGDDEGSLRDMFDQLQKERVI
ncbi:MAG: hypothetical protein JRG73_09760 [Deltaproteobacteria bacterium]|nr:hypothetical protein [Deltaproteobacteria bacterium]MBW2307209.1 hypothetical protein [Deltaproteobacteria bacterium]